MGQYRKVAKVLIGVNKKEDMTEDEVVQYFSQKHGQLGVQLMKRHGAISSSQHFTLSKDKQALDTIMHGHAPLMSFDAITTVLFPNLEAVQNLLQDPDDRERMVADSLNVVKPGSLQMTVGDEYVQFE